MFLYKLWDLSMTHLCNQFHRGLVQTVIIGGGGGKNHTGSGILQVCSKQYYEEKRGFP